MGFTLRVIVACLIIAASAAAALHFLGIFAPPNEGRQQRAQTPPVLVETVKRQEFVDQIEAIGTTFAQDSIVLAAPVTELIGRINFDDGQRVKRGDVLVELSSDVVKAQLASAEATLTEAEKQLARIQTLSERGTATEVRLDEQLRVRDTARADVARIEAELERRIIRAPFDGVIGLKRVSLGALVQPGADLATLQNIATLKLDFTVPEIYFASLKASQDIIARSPVYPNREFKGQVSVIDPRVDEVSRAVTVRALLPNSSGELKPGMLMSVSVIRERAEVLMVPEQAVVSIGRKSYVYRLQDQNKLKQTEIGTGRRKPGFIEVVSGLSEADVIVVEGTVRVKDGMTVQPQNRSANGTNLSFLVSSTPNTGSNAKPKSLTQ
jgi:membrane fusion protein (multidrug efflux system)